MRASGIRSSNPSASPRPARRIGTITSFLPSKSGASMRLDRGLDVSVHQRQVAGGVVAQQQADLAQQAAEIGARRLLVTHLGELVLHQRMARNVNGMRQ